jgi:hypothetical protein
MTIEDFHDRVLNELRTYIDRSDRILSILAGKQSISISECESVRELYVALKRDLKEASKRGTLLSKAQRNEHSVEDSIYGSAVRHASIELRPKTNTSPINARWQAAVSSCKSELMYYLERLPEKAR